MVPFITVREFLETCNRGCLVRKERCTRYRTVHGYLVDLETRFEKRKDVIPCDCLTSSNQMISR